MRIIKSKKVGARYPYNIKNAFGKSINCSLEELEDLAFEIERIFKEERAKSMLQVAVEVVIE